MYNARERVLTKELEFLVYGELNATTRHVVTSILPCALATSLESPVVMANVADIDMLMLRRRPATGRRKKVLKEQLLF